MTVEEGLAKLESPSEIIPDRIFVGNLPYEVTEDDVRNLTPEFEVVSVEIPRKNFFNRELGDYVIQSKGYGFITYTNAEDAKVAISSIVGKCIAGREIYAKYALPQNKTKIKDRQQSQNNHNNHHHYNQLGVQGYPKFAGYAMPSHPMHQIHPIPNAGPYSINNKVNNGNGPPMFFPTNATPFYPMGKQVNGFIPGPPPPVSQQISTKSNVADDGEQQDQQQHSPVSFNSPNLKNVQPFFPQLIPAPYGFAPYMVRRDDKQRRLANGTPSKLTVFVGNLERNVTVDILKDFMKETNPAWIKVPRQSYPPHIYRYMRENDEVIQNKGIAFINYETHEAQLRAIELFDGKELRGKKLNVTVAINANDEQQSSLPNQEVVDEVDDDTDVEVVLGSSTTAPTSAEEFKDEE